MSIFVNERRLSEGLAKTLYNRVLPHIGEKNAAFVSQCIFEMTVYSIHMKNSKVGFPEKGQADLMVSQIQHILSNESDANQMKDLLSILREDTSLYNENFQQYNEELERFSVLERITLEPPTDHQLTRVLFEMTGDPLAEGRLAGLAVGGNSKQTLFFDYYSGSELVDSLVMRRDLFYAHSSRSSVIDEFAVLKALFSQDIQIAEPLFVDPSRSILNTPYLVSKRVAGKIYGNSLGCREEIGWDSERQIAMVLANLHGLEYQSHPGFGNIEKAQKIDMKSWEELYRSHIDIPSAAIEVGIAWLKRNAAIVSDRLSLVHGDVGYHNILFNEGELTALVDWELVHIGNPAEDLSYVMNVSKDKNRFYRDYVKAGGAEISQNELEYFEVFSNVRNAIYGVVALRQFNNGDYFDVSTLPIIISSYSTHVRKIESKLSQLISAHGFVWS
jgi:aminoglycoside phosphotransferase (APT) family kinase protein